MKAGRKSSPPSAELYLRRAEELLRRIREEQAPRLAEAAELMADAIAGEGVVYLFGSGHSILPAMDVFPRYGSFVGFRPLLDPRLMWWNVIGPGGVRELLWLERSEGYARIFLGSYRLRPRDVMLVYSHGGLNAAPVEVALEAKRLGLQVIAVTSLGNTRSSSPRWERGSSTAASAWTSSSRRTRPAQCRSTTRPSSRRTDVPWSDRTVTDRELLRMRGRHRCRRHEDFGVPYRCGRASARAIRRADRSAGRRRGSPPGHRAGRTGGERCSCPGRRSCRPGCR